MYRSKRLETSLLLHLPDSPAVRPQRKVYTRVSQEVKINVPAAFRQTRDGVQTARDSMSEVADTSSACVALRTEVRCPM
jgi:hypothetical protein